MKIILQSCNKFLTLNKMQVQKFSCELIEHVNAVNDVSIFYK